jgi:alanine-glyoxylate transaminase/serine-glyoxylate transaminase/serine-pyruvate transaminase
MIQLGRHFLQIPGPTNVPDRILRAMDRPVIDHRGPEFAALAREVLWGMKVVFRTTGPVVIYPASGTGAWEAAIVNTLSPGDRVLLFETGHFSQLWRELAERFAVHVEYVPGDWRRGPDPSEVEARLRSDDQHSFKAVMVVHNETSTGVTSRVSEIRQAINRAQHPALFLVDTISSLASIDYRHEEWGVDVSVAGSQKGLIEPAFSLSHLPRTSSMDCRKRSECCRKPACPTYFRGTFVTRRQLARLWRLGVWKLFAPTLENTPVQ